MMQAGISSQRSAFAWTQGYLQSCICGCLLAYIAILPFKSLLVLERNGFLVLLGLLTIWCLLTRRLFYVPSPYDRMLIAFVVWVGLTIPFSVSPLYSVKEYGKLLQHVVMFYAVTFFLREERYRESMFYILGIVVIVAAGYGLTQFTLADPQAVRSIFSAEVWFTTFLVMLFPFALALAFEPGRAPLQWGAAVVSSACVTCLIMTQSRAGLLALVVELWAVAWLIRSIRARMVAGLVTLCLIVAVLFAFNVDLNGGDDALRDARASLPIQTKSHSIIHRLDIWAFTLSEIARHGIVGIGYGPHSYLFTYGGEEETTAPGHATVKKAGTHNIFLYLALHVGLPGMILFAWLYYSFITTTVREYRRASHGLQKSILAGSLGSLLGLLCRLQFDQMLVGSLAVLFWVLLAMAVLYYPSLKSQSGITQSAM